MTMTQAPTHPVVLVVDDDPELLTLARMQLEDDFEVLSAGGGKECLDLAARHSPDVILLDMMMPDMDGREVLAHLASDPHTAGIPVVFLSALDDVKDKVEGLQSGAVDYITKPAEPEELAARLTLAVQARPKDEIDLDLDLPDQADFKARVAEEIHRADRSKSPLSILLIQIDGTDSVLETQASFPIVAASLRTTLRVSDVLCRYDDTTFAAVLPDTNTATAYYAAERCRAGLKGLRDGERVTLSIGIAELANKRTVDEIVDKAVMALGRAKESGGDQSWRADDLRRTGTSPSALSGELTEREWDVLSHLVNKRTEIDIAKRLGISAGTVRSHKARIRRKLAVSPNVRLYDFAKANFKDMLTEMGRSAPERGE